MPCFSRKLILSSITKFTFGGPHTNIQSLRRCNLGFWQTWKQVNTWLQCGGKLRSALFSWNVFLFLLTKFGFFFLTFYQYSFTQKIRFMFLIIFTTISKLTLIWAEIPRKVLRYFLFSNKDGFVFVEFYP